MPNKWKLRSKETLSPKFLNLCEEDSLLARLLVNRSVTDEALLNYYINTQGQTFSSPFEIPEMEKAFKRVKAAIDKGEKILIYGDYDVDGTSSVALLYRSFSMIGVSVSFYIPNRLHEGYGLNKNAIKKIREVETVDLMITCDCGISNFHEIEYANSLGLDVIVTDHHSIPLNPPPSIANCNPKTLSESHPLHYLPGVGVAFKLAETILNEYCDDALQRDNYLYSLLDLVAVGIVADLAPLKSENRILCIRGLEVLAKTKKPGLQKLLDISGSAENGTTEHIGFGIAPRINAAGRLSDAVAAVRLMITEDYVEAEELCAFLDSENLSRQELCNRIFESALVKMSEDMNLSEEKVIVLGDSTWHHGVIGIVASRLVEQFNLPVFIMAIENDICKGSVRGVDVGNLDIFHEMQSMQEKENIFLKYGGHKLAAGFSIAKDDFRKFIDLCRLHFRQRLSGVDLAKLTKIDSALFLEENNEKLLKRIEKLAPFGIDHPQPVFVSGPLKIVSQRYLGKEKKHLKLLVKAVHKGLKTYEAVIWNKAEEFMRDFSKLESSLYLAYTPKINEFMNEKFIQLDVKDWKVGKDIEVDVIERLRKAPFLSPSSSDANSSIIQGLTK